MFQTGLYYYLSVTKLSLEEVVSFTQYCLTGRLYFPKTGTTVLSPIPHALLRCGLGLATLHQKVESISHPLIGGPLSDSLVIDGLLRLGQKRSGSFHPALLKWFPSWNPAATL